MCFFLEMNEYEPGHYTDYVLDAVKDLREQGKGK